MDGFGKVVRESNEPLFHAPWERRVFGMLLTTMGQGVYNLDEMRHTIERMPAADYLRTSYYEHWLHGLETVMIEKGIADAAEIERKVREVASAPTLPAAPERNNPVLVQGLLQALRVSGAPSSRGKGRARFRKGDGVRVRKMNPRGHTRCPRYVRGARGTVERVHERHVFPDAHAHGGGEAPQMLYTIGFNARELWGDGAEGRGRIFVDLWEPYLAREAGSTAKARAPRAKIKTPKATKRKATARAASKSSKSSKPKSRKRR